MVFMIEELISERNNLLDDIKEYENNNNYNYKYRMMNDKIVALTKSINNCLLRRQFSYTSYSTHNMLPNNYIVFDTETTGLNPETNEIIEFTFLKYENNILVDKLSSLVRPEELIPDFITNITHISNEDVLDKKDINYYLEDIIKFINKSIIIGHNVLFDIKFLREAISKSNLDLEPLNIQYIDTVNLARKCIIDVPNHKLETLKNYFNINCISHRSEADCEVTKIVYEKCVEILNNNKTSSV
jgi:DNA polymerase-3 subunit epsilon